MTHMCAVSVSCHHMCGEFRDGRVDTDSVGGVPDETLDPGNKYSTLRDV